MLSETPACLAVPVAGKSPVRDTGPFVAEPEATVAGRAERRNLVGAGVPGAALDREALLRWTIVGVVAVPRHADVVADDALTDALALDADLAVEALRIRAALL